MKKTILLWLTVVSFSSMATAAPATAAPATAAPAAAAPKAKPGKSGPTKNARTPNQLMWEAIKYDSPKALASALSKGANPNHVDYYKDTPLLAAIGKESPQAVTQLLKAGADVNYFDMPPLNLACSYGGSAKMTAIVKLLLDKGAHIDGTLGNGATPLMCAAREGMTDVVNLLLARGARIDLIDTERKNALDYASRCTIVEPAALLYARGLRVAGRGAEKDALLGLFAADWQPRIVEELLQDGANPGTVSQWFGQAPLMRAVSRKPEGEKGWKPMPVKPNPFISWSTGMETQDPNWKSSDEQAWPTLPAAMAKAQLETIEVLLRYGANIDLPDDKGVTPLMSAIELKRFEAATFLLEKGASVSRRDRKGRTPLDCARREHYLQAIDIPMVRLLIQHGADINAADGSGTTLLMKSVKPYDYKGFRFLLEQGADVNRRNRKKQTALHLAADWRASDSVYRTTGSDNLEAVRLLIKYGADINAASGDGATPLVMAASERVNEFRKPGGFPVTDFLLAHGAKFPGPGRARQMLFLRAASGGNIALVKKALQLGVDINYRSQGTALERASWGNHRDIARLLRQRGARESVR